MSKGEPLCEACPKGSFGTGAGQADLKSCTLCAAGKFSDALGATSEGTCQDCTGPAGTYCPVGSQSSSGVACPAPGYTCLQGGSAAPAPVSAGYFTADGGKTEAQCAAGYCE
jgi:hypothetical protein